MRDRAILHDWHVQNFIEMLGPVLPGYLELCYLLVYAVGFYGITVLYLLHKRERVADGKNGNIALAARGERPTTRWLRASSSLTRIISPTKSLRLEPPLCASVFQTPQVIVKVGREDIRAIHR